MVQLELGLAGISEANYMKDRIYAFLDKQELIIATDVCQMITMSKVYNYTPL